MNTECQLTNKVIIYTVSDADTTFFIDDDSRVYSRGFNLDFKLGYHTPNQNRRQRNKFRVIDELTGQGIIKIVTCLRFTVFLSSTGQVFKTTRVCPFIEAVPLENKIDDIGMCSFSATLWNKKGELLLLHRDGVFQFNIPFPTSSFSCGYDHGTVLDKNGNVWVWGSNSKGQLNFTGVFSDHYIHEPTMLPYMKNWKLQCSGYCTLLKNSQTGIETTYGLPARFEIVAWKINKRKREF